MDRVNIGWSKDDMAKLVANDIPDGSYVNLGIGIPELVANYIPEGREIIIHTENGLLGVGPAPAPGEEDFDLINAGKKPITTIKGACFFHHADSFAMIRGGHLDFTVLGAYQVSQNGDLANWSTGSPNDIPAVGGAMDLVQGVKNVFVIMSHTTKNGTPKIVKKCTYPLTGVAVVSRIYTDLAIIDVTNKGLKVIKLAPGIDKDTLINKTEADLIL
ncbi:MAG: 3-oxoacid CoA-transferase subunit B [Bacteroidales bacterium]|jgi:3-oxoadipate CoA-transferase beta subunit|nr:3-oxoacid CoA-transferase subunit B [Bacteroidales bacterium]MDI9575581.1 3-oxoacid CoA-transferase subunit B [Bacteroidota bacterium]MDD3756337.1 3-oxoacid CoA-transferase subunit B [Bacteroidales bacterium]MDY0401147.1 3-oxoacid CoA-transferase subunit B [Bacteroidales bacterium]HHW59153.1 CoA transferase subunit B [Bacteroidales bacterium]